MATSGDDGDRGLIGMCLSEMVGTALLVLVGLSIVIFDLGAGSPLATVIPAEGGRRALTGLLFGTTGMAIALSPVGRVSGAHINPVVSLAFWFEKSLPGRALVPFVASQLVGAVLGAVPLLAWGSMGRSLSYGATAPGVQGVALAFVGEVVTTFLLIVLLLSFVGHRRLRRYTPAMFPFLYCAMVWLEAPWSGTSTNPARSLGPDVVALSAHSYWLYWAAPVLGTALAVLARRSLPVLRDLEVDVAKLSHFDVDPFERLWKGPNRRRPLRRCDLAGPGRRPSRRRATPGR